MDDTLLVKVWHGGKLSVKPTLHYEGGDTHMFKVDVDKVSYFELMDFVMDFGSYKSKDFDMYYLVPGKKFEEGLVQLKDDKDVSEMMITLGDEVKHILNLYATEKAHVKTNTAQASTAAAHLNPTQTTPERKGITKSSARRLPSTTPNKEPICYSGSDTSGSETSGSDKDYNGDEDDVDSSAGTDKDDDEWRASVAAIKVNKEKELTVKELLEHLNQGETSSAAEKKQYYVEEPSDASSYEESDGDVCSPGESEDDDIRGKKHKSSAPYVTENTDWTNWNWVAGTRFPTKDAFKKAVTKYAVTNGRNLKVSVSNKNRSSRLGYSCVKGCPFYVYVSLHKSKGCYMVKSANNTHTCQRNMSKNIQLTADYIATEFLPIFKQKPNWPAKEIQDVVKEKFKVFISKWLAYNAKACAQNKLHGSMLEHYSKVGSYLEALKQANPTYTFELLTVPARYLGVDDDKEVFFRLFVCFEAVKKGFLAGCRKVICLDGCFLKTFLGGMLLAAIGRDANDQMFPIAWAVVEGENNDSWTWFMVELKKCLEVSDDGKGWTLVSDQQKGLLNATALIWGNAEHRNCARHIYANWHKNSRGMN